MKPIFALAIFVAFCAASLARGEGSEIQLPRATIEVYSFGYFIDFDPPKTRLFTFERGEAGYSIKWNIDGSPVCRDVAYVKTFGGKEPVVSIHLVNSRFVIYPETVKESSVSGAMFNDMKAITHIYDAKQKKIIYSSKPYQYNHDVPLKYSYLDVLVIAENEDLFENTDAENDKADRPDTVPEKKTESRKNASPD